ncbi:MAG: bifunctional diaminohydroxyphosphoribosylaminopyrimidine deaminase/5-amino-6-(5-phosphoribosylamino)uracil reductase RibD [Acidimicrobiales bacterium]
MTPHDVTLDDERFMRRAIELGQSVRRQTSPNPWVGSVVLAADGSPAGEGATSPPGGAHAEAAALAAAGELARGGTCYTTLEPCVTQGRTPPCAAALVAAGVHRVVVALIDPDDGVQGRGVASLAAAGIEVVTGVLAEAAEESLRPYLVQRRTLRPYVVLKLAATLDGRIAAPDGTSRWITGEAARGDVQRLRAESDAILVGAGTVRADDPQLTVRTDPPPLRQPLRVVLGRAPDGARVQPALEMSGDVRGVLDELGRRGVLQLLVEGGASVAGEFHRAGAVDRYVVYLTGGFLGGDDGVAMFAGPGASTMSDLWRGRLVALERFGDDVRLDVEAVTGQ